MMLVTPTDNVAGGSIAMNYEIWIKDAVTIDDDIISADLQYLEDYFYQQHSAPADQFYCSHHILSSSHNIFASGNNSSYS